MKNAVGFRRVVRAARKLTSLKPVLFLDIDGVLNSMDFYDNRKVAGWPSLDPLAIPRLQRIVDETRCQVILSSSWRRGRGSLTKVNGYLHAAGMRCKYPLSGKTPEFDSLTRGAEISGWWVSKGFPFAPHGCPPYVCLDDEDDGLTEHAHPLVQTSFALGLTTERADRCIAILKENTHA